MSNGSYFYDHPDHTELLISPSQKTWFQPYLTTLLPLIVIRENHTLFLDSPIFYFKRGRSGVHLSVSLAAAQKNTNKNISLLLLPLNSFYVAFEIKTEINPRQLQ